MATEIQVTLLVGDKPRHWQEHLHRCPEGMGLQDFLQRNAAYLQGLLGDAWPQCACSVWGHKQHPHYVLRSGDRVEITRNLRVDPKVARRERFQAQGKRRAGLFSKKTDPV